METPDRLTDAESDSRRTPVLIGLGYVTLCVVAVWLDFKYQMWRSRKKREREKKERPRDA